MAEETKRGSNGGRARAANLTKEKRSAIASAAAVKRWGAKRESKLDEVADIAAAVIQTIEKEITSDPEEKHCPACMNGQSLEEGEGTHILATIEHPVTLPAAFQEAEASVTIATPPPVSAKPSKRQAKPMPKEFKSASSYAEKRLPQAIKEKSEAVAIVAAREAEINDLMRVIKALGGAVEPQTAHGYPNTSYNPPYTPPQLPPPYPEYQQPAPVMPVVTPPKPMAAGGAGVAAGMLEVPSHWYEG